MKSIIVVLFLYCSSVFAGSVSIKLDDPNHEFKKPANDLVYNDQRISSYEALNLAQTGFDISNLNPHQSHLWSDSRLSLLPELDKASLKGSFQFIEHKSSPSELFRARVGLNGDDYTLIASLDNHSNMIRAALLRKLGYNITLPIFFKNLEVEFKNIDERDKFLEKLGEDTLTKRDRWIDKSENELKLNLKDVLIEPSKLKNVNLYLPFMSSQRQESRRIFRALLAIYDITNFPQSVNSIDWESVRIFNNHMTINHPYAGEFKDISESDLIWITKKLNRLTRNDLKEVLLQANYPDDISALVLEKILSRINKYSNIFKTNHHYIVNKQLSYKNITNGVYTNNAYPEFVNNFFKDAPDSPYRYSELFKLFRSEITYNALSSILESAVEKFVPGIDTNDALENIQDNIADYRVNHPGSNGQIPLKSFSSPTASLNTSLRRNIVFGNHLGQNAPIQLVDTVGADVNLGVYSMITGVQSDILPTVAASVSFSRTYSHVRAMPDLETASNQSIKKLLIPSLMKKLGRQLTLEQECRYDQYVTVDEGVISGSKVIYIKYNTEEAQTKEMAIFKREDLIRNGTEESSILLMPIKRTEECESEIETLRNTNMESLLKELALNETFIINDSINLIGNVKANIPLSTYLNQQLSLSIGTDHAKGFLKSILIRKKEDLFEISIQSSDNRNHSISMGLNYFFEIIKGTKKWVDGHQKTLLYKVKFNETDKEKKVIALKTIRELFISSETRLLKEHYSPLTIENDIDGDLITLKKLWFKSEYMKLDNLVKIILPKNEYPNLSLEERIKILFATSDIRRTGKNIFGFINSYLNTVSNFLRIGQDANDSGQNIKGSSKSRYYTSEGDITPGEDLNITTKVEYIWKGWEINNSSMSQIFDFIEGLFVTNQNTTNLFNRDLLSHSGPLKGYEVRTSIIIYPSFMDKFEDQFLNVDQDKSIELLKYLYQDKKWKRYCKRRNISSNRKCLPLGAKILIKIKTKFKENLDGVDKIKKQNLIILTLLESFDRQRVIKWIGSENLFTTTRVTGFLENNEKGFIDYISNSFGRYQTNYGTGVFDQITNILGITPYELRALNYTPGM